MKFQKTLVAVSLLCLTVSLPGRTHAAAGDLDPTFGTGGLTITNTTGKTPKRTDADWTESLLLQPDGKIVAAGFTVDRRRLAIGLLRYNSDGSLDATFGSGGIVSTVFTEQGDRFGDAALQSDGKILVVATGLSAARPVTVARFLPDGTPDSAFGTGGQVTVSFGEGNSVAPSVVTVQPDGKIVLAGITDPNVALARLNGADGSLDPTFGQNGIILDAIGGESTAFTVPQAVVQVIDGQTRILALVVFRQSGDMPIQFTLARFLESGALDPSFGLEGIASSAFGNDAQSSSFTTDAEGRIVVAGGSGSNVAVARFSSDGVLDPAFGNGGQALLAATGVSSIGPFGGVSVEADNGRIVIVGTTNDRSRSGFIARFESDGTPDTTFAISGGLFVQYGNKPTDFRALILQTVVTSSGPRQRIIVGGSVVKSRGYNKLAAAYLL